MVNTTLPASSTITVDNNNANLFALGGDKKHIYWSGGRGWVVSSEKHSSSSLDNREITELVASGVRELHSFGRSAQPFPPKECLLPKRMLPEEPLLYNHSSHSLHLDLPLGVSVNCSLEEKEVRIKS